MTNTPTIDSVIEQLKTKGIKVDQEHNLLGDGSTSVVGYKLWVVSLADGILVAFDEVGHEDGVYVHAACKIRHQSLCGGLAGHVAYRVA